MFSCGICKTFKNTYFEEQLRTNISETFSFSWTAKLFWLNWSLCFSFCIIIYGFVHQFPLPYWYCCNQKQSTGNSLQSKCSYKFPKIHKETPALFHEIFRSTEFWSILSKKRFRHRCFLVNFVKFLIAPFLTNPLDGSFCLKTRSVYCSTITFAFSNPISHILSGWVFSWLNS